MRYNTALDLKRRANDNEARIRLYGPEPINPFKSLRKQKGLTLGDIEAYTGIDRRALSRVERGLYTNPLPNLINYWVRKDIATEGQLLNDYADYQDLQRARHYKYFGESLNVDSALDQHPFRQLRANRPSLATGFKLPVGLTECCEALCLPLDTIQYFEKKFRLQRSVPKNLLNALNQIGYSREEIEGFERVYVVWRDRSKQVTFS